MQRNIHMPDRSGRYLEKTSSGIFPPRDLDGQQFLMYAAVLTASPQYPLERDASFDMDLIISYSVLFIPLATPFYCGVYTIVF